MKEAKEIMGVNFFGPEEVNAVLGLEFPKGEFPKLLFQRNSRKIKGYASTHIIWREYRIPDNWDILVLMAKNLMQGFKTRKKMAQNSCTMLIGIKMRNSSPEILRNFNGK